MLLAFAAIFYLTWESVVNHDWEKAKAQGAIGEEVQFDPDSEGYQIYAGSSCIGCHGNAFEGGLGPPLINTGLTADEIADIAHNGIGAMPQISGQVPKKTCKSLQSSLQRLKTEK